MLTSSATESTAWFRFLCDVAMEYCWSRLVFILINQLSTHLPVNDFYFFLLLMFVPRLKCLAMAY